MLRNIPSILKRSEIYKNSLYLITSNVYVSLSGFIFWIIVARFYKPEDVGIATALFSLMVLISNFSLVGLPTGLLRFLPTASDSSRMINSSISLVSSVSILLSVLSVLYIQYLSPNLVFVKENWIFVVCFVVFTVFSTANSLLDGILISLRQSAIVFWKSITFGVVKLVLPILLITLGAFGIYTSISLGFILSFFCGVVLLQIAQQMRIKFVSDYKSVLPLASYSLGIFISGLVGTLPTYILPLLITNMLSPAAVAYYYMATTIANTLFIVPQVVTQNLLVEGSHDFASIRKHLYQSLKMIFSLLLPGVFVLILVGKYILLAFGKNYSNEGIALLQILTLSSIPVALNYVLGTILALRNSIKSIIGMSTVNSLLTIVLSYLFINQSITGIGYATLVTQSVLVLFYLILLFPLWRSYLRK